MSTLGSSPHASACTACARPISPPPGQTAALFDMFCDLNGATRTPARANARHSAVTTTLLPTSDAVPITIKLLALNSRAPVRANIHWNHNILRCDRLFQYRIPFNKERTNMQMGMVGLGRMGANMVRRLLRGGHECVVFDVSADAVKELAKEGAIGASSLDDFAAKLKLPRVAWMMVPAAVVEQTVADLSSRFQRDDIIVDGGNSYYIDDIRRAEALAGEGDSLRRFGHQRRRVGTRARLLPDDRRRAASREASRFDFRHARAADRFRAAHRRPRESQGQHRRARLSALRTERRGSFCEDGSQRNRVRDHGGVRGRA